MNNKFDNFLGPGAVAVIGASDNRGNFGRVIYRTLRDKGYEVFPVNPRCVTVDGHRCYDRVAAIEKQVESVVVAVSPEIALSLTNSLAEAGVQRLWFQRGADFSAAATRARDLGLEVVEGRCILMYTNSVTGVHAVHRFFSRITGNLQD